MDIDEAFSIFYSRIVPSEATLAKARQHCDFIKQILQNDNSLAPKKFYYSGSYAKSTCINPLKDVDLAPHYDLQMCKKSNGNFYSPGTILGWFFTRLQQTFASKLTVRRQKRSIGIRFVDFDVEIVPVFWDGNEDYMSYLPDREEKEWIKTSIPKHIDLLAKKDLTYRPYAKTIRLMKEWKMQNAVSLKGFAIELLCIKALDKFGTSQHLGITFSNVMRYVYETRLDDIVGFNTYYPLYQIKIPKSPVMIVDPVNSRNNVTDDITKDDKERILNKFDHAYKQATWALDAEDRNDIKLARERWRAILGDNFPIG